MSTLRVEALEQPDGTAFIFNNKNLLINGGMNVWQRSTSESVTTTGYYTADRFVWSRNGSAVYTMSRSTDVPSSQGFGYSLKLDNTTATSSLSAANYHLIEQIIEGQNVQHLLKGTSNAKKVTLSFWVKSNKTGTYIVRFKDLDNSRNISKAYTIDTASTWEKKTITIDGDTTGTFDNDNAGSFSIQWWLATGSLYSSGTLATSWESNTSANYAVGQVNLADSTSNEFFITGCQLEVGSTASGFEFEPFEAILRKCQRYYEKSYEYSTALGTSTFNGAYYDEVGGTNYPRLQAHYSVRKRTRVPNTITVYNPNTGTAGQMYIWDNGTARYYSLGNTRYTFNSFSTEGQNNGFNLNNRAWGGIHYAVDYEI
jgi:hypothetical protein